MALRTTASTTAANGLKYTISVPSIYYKVGQTIPITLTVTNTRSIDVSGVYGVQSYDAGVYAGIAYPSTQSYYESTTEVWEYDYGKTLPPVVVSLLPPGQSVSFEFDWNQMTGATDQPNAVQVPASNYFLTAGVRPMGSAWPTLQVIIWSAL